MEWIVLLGFILAFLCSLWAYMELKERKEFKRVHREIRDSEIAFQKYQRELDFARYGRSIGRKY